MHLTIFRFGLDLVMRFDQIVYLLFDVKDRGYIREGYYADLVVLDLDKEFEVTKKDVLYQCGWSPFEGAQFKGYVEATLLNGQWAYSKGQVHPQSAAMELTFDRE